MNERSMKNLEGVHPDLRKIILEAYAQSPVKFIVTEGIRTRQRQAVLVAQGASKTMNSRHLTGHAADIAPIVDGEVRWDWPLFHAIAPVVKEAAKKLGLKVEWGGDWKKFRDGPHFQLPRKEYP